MTQISTSAESLNTANSVNEGANQLSNLAMKNELSFAKKETAVSKEMTVQVMEKTESGYTFKEEKRKFGLIKENRPIKKTDVNGFLQIIQNGKYDESQSIVTAEASELIGDYNITDLEGNPITEEDATDYLIVLDGQHRVTAFSKLNAIRKSENQLLIPNVHIKTGLKNVREYLADINMIGHNWSTADKICVSAIASENKLLDKINELIKEGYNASTAILICTGKKVTAKQLKTFITTGDTSCFPDEEEALERAEKFLTTAMSIPDMVVKMLSKRYFIKGFNSFAKSRNDEDAFTALANLTIDDFKETKEDEDFIEKLKLALEAALEAA